ncbi:MAG: type II toxin-antitoxin system RelE/ParE family toxin [Proteobacteria bacterium]|nr:type II toxin-antitoxin system RelE/ParE family toxin [Pseudomonadota bacterium]
MATKSGWTIEYFRIAKKEMRKEPDLIQAKFARIFALIEDKGYDKAPSLDIKKLTDKIWELRVWGRGTTSRALYLLFVGRRVIILHVFTKKKQHTEQHHIELALQRAKEFENAEQQKKRL